MKNDILEEIILDQMDNAPLIIKFFNHNLNDNDNLEILKYISSKHKTTFKTVECFYKPIVAIVK